MYDYTTEGLHERQREIALAYLDLIDTKLNKIKKRLTVISVVVVAGFVIKNKDKILALKNMKGE